MFIFAVYSGDIKWVPIGRHGEIYPQGEEQLGVLERDILIAKMRPGHEIHVFMHAVKGIGKDHAKFAPVGNYRHLFIERNFFTLKSVPLIIKIGYNICKLNNLLTFSATASYRLLPEIKITTPVRGEQAHRLKSCFSPGVIELVNHSKNGVEARVKNARYDSCSRNVFRYDDLKDAVQLSRVPDHFICKLILIVCKQKIRLFRNATLYFCSYR